MKRLVVVMTFPQTRLHWLQGLLGRSPGPFFNAQNAGGGAEPAGRNRHLKGALGGNTTTV